LLVTHIDKNYKLTRWALSGVMAQALRLAANPIAAAEMEVDQLKFHQRLVDKLKYCKEVLVNIKTAGGAEEAVGVVGDEGGVGGIDGIGAKASKMSLR
jgi:cell cycle serine/threonine-protein kinase CDC5/MSD2